MMKIEALIQPYQLDAVKAALDQQRVVRVLYCHVMEHNSQGGLKAHYRGTEYGVDTAKVKLEVLVSSLNSGDVMKALSDAARTDADSDDGVIVVTEVAETLHAYN
jgi:nitrogen regulatory protein P-II 1